MTHHRKVKFHNIALVVFGLGIAGALSRIDAFGPLLMGLGSFGYIGIFLAGMLFVSTFTVAIGVLLLSVFVREFPLPVVAFIAGLGGVIGDLLIFRFVRDDLRRELRDLYDRFGGKHITVLFHTRYFRWMLPVIGAAIIASPLPDELGVSLMGIASMETKQFVLLSFVLNTLGIFLLLFIFS